MFQRDFIFHRKIVKFIVVCILPVWIHLSCASLNCTNFLSENWVWFAQDLPNFHKVNDKIYRGGQPTKKGFRRLKRIGVKTVVNLRSGSKQIRKEKKTVTSLGLNYISIPIKGGNAPTNNQVKKFFSIVKDEKLTPVFVHCLMGSDRTGVVIAAYRICIEGWTADRAYEEMKARDFNQSFGNLRKFVYNLEKR